MVFFFSYGLLHLSQMHPTSLKHPTTPSHFYYSLLHPSKMNPTSLLHYHSIPPLHPPPYLTSLNIPPLHPHIRYILLHLLQTHPAHSHESPPAAPSPAEPSSSGYLSSIDLYVSSSRSQVCVVAPVVSSRPAPPTSPTMTF